MKEPKTLPACPLCGSEANDMMPERACCSVIKCSLSWCAIPRDDWARLASPRIAPEAEAVLRAFLRRYDEIMPSVVADRAFCQNHGVPWDKDFNWKAEVDALRVLAGLTPEGKEGEQVTRFARREPCGTTGGWQIRKDGSEYLAGAKERVACAGLDARPGYVHIMLDC